MKKILYFILFVSASASGQNLSLPFGVKVVNPKPLDVKFWNDAGTPYTDAAEVLSELSAGERHQGLAVWVGNERYVFKNGIDDADLVADSTRFWNVAGYTPLLGNVDIDVSGYYLNFGSPQSFNIIDAYNIKFSAYDTIQSVIGTSYSRIRNGNVYAQVNSTANTASLNLKVAGFGADWELKSSDDASPNTVFKRIRSTSSAIEVTASSGSTVARSIYSVIGSTPTITQLGKTILQSGTTVNASLNIPSGVAPTSPVNYDIWNDGTLLYRLSGVNQPFVFADLAQTLTSKTLTSPIINYGSDAAGDLYRRNSANTGQERVPAGTDTHVLTLVAGVPSWAAPSGGGLTVGTSTITSGTNTKVLYNNSGVLGEYTVSGTGNVALTTSPTFTTPALGTPSALVGTNITGTATGLTSGITNALKSATTTVDVSAATAPTSGQVLTATSGTAATWQTPSGGGGAWSLASGGTATGTNTFAMGSNPFILTSGVTTGTGATAGIQNVFNSLTTGNGLDISSSSVSSGSIVKITGTGTAAASNTQKGLWVDVSGANATSSQTTYGGYFRNTKTGTSTTNIAGYFEASGGTNNIAIRTSGGGVGIGINPGIYDLSTSGAYGVSIITTTSSTPLYINASGAATGVFEMASLSVRRNRIFFTSASTYFETPNIGIGAAATSNTSLDIRGTGTTTNKTLRTANSANTQTFEILDNANINALPLSGSIMTLGGGATASQLRFLEPSGGGANYSSFSAVAQSANINYSLPPTVAVAGAVLSDVAGNGVLTWEDKSLQSATNTKTEKVIYNVGTIGSAATSTYSIHAESYYANGTTLLAKITVVAVKTDGSASAHSTVTARFRKNSSGTWSVDDAGTDITSDITILADVVGDFSTNPNVKVTMGAASGNYNVSWVAETIEVK